MKAYANVDSAGLALSVLCTIHCLILPILGTSLPLLGAWSEVEWIHKAFVLLALPIGLSLFRAPSRPFIRVMAISGITLLFAAAFVPQLHDAETIITVIGATFLGGAHLLRLSAKNHSH